MYNRRYLKFLIPLFIIGILIAIHVVVTREPIDKDTLLENVNDLIYKYIDLPHELFYGSAAIPIAVCGLITTGDILEIGMGTFSSNILHKIGIRP